MTGLPDFLTNAGQADAMHFFRAGSRSLTDTLRNHLPDTDSAPAGENKLALSKPLAHALNSRAQRMGQGSEQFRQETAGHSGIVSGERGDDRPRCVEDDLFGRTAAQSRKRDVPAPPRSAGAVRTDTRILLVDDEKMILKTVPLMLSEFGLLLKTASSAVEALEAVRNNQFDIVFLDQHIGKDRGLDLMPRIAEIDPSLYYVIITANGNTDLAVDALKRGASDFLVKPFFAADVLRSIEFVLRKRDLDRQKRELLEGLEAKVRERTQELESLYVDVLASLAQALEARDSSTYGHCKRVSDFAGQIADRLGFDGESKRHLEIAALLHDVGKIGINDLILMKPGALNSGEWTDLRDHPEKGVEILRPLKYLEPALPGILHHHENYDGSGYPRGLKGDAIPLAARIISVADAWDVMQSDRPYRKAREKEDALRELKQYAGIQFDPAIVDIFIDLVRKSESPW